MAVPYTFGSATTSIPLSQLDSNFATTITLGNTAIQLGNTVTTLNNMTLGNVTISSGTSNIQTNVANATGVLLEANGGTGTTTGYYGFKNRIINGAMVISQRNGTSTVTPSSGDYTLDRYKFFASQASKITIAQSSDAPTGFINSLLATTATAYTPSGSDYFAINQRIEGLNIADLAWGSANAKAVTISFWVKSSLTGTFAGTLQNSSGNYSYPFTYSIPSASTWTQIVLNVAGPTSGTWLTTNGVGIIVQFNLGYGTTYNGTANTWASGDYENVSGAVNMVATGSATLQFTGVQLEKGSTATSFDYRPYGTELALCQRYFQTYNADGSALKAVMPYQSAATAGELDAYMVLPVPMRSAPAAAISNLTAYDGVTSYSLTSITTYLNTSSVFGCYFGSSGLTLYRPYMVRTASGTTGYLQLSSEL